MSTPNAHVEAVVPLPGNPEEQRKFEMPAGPLPVLKMPDPPMLVARLQEDKSAGVLSRRKQEGRSGEAQILLNEIEPTEAKATFAWAIVVLREPQEFASLDDVPKELREGIDKFSLAEFEPVKPVFYIPMELVRAFDPPIELKKTPPGRRYGPEIDLEEEAVAKGEGDLTTADLDTVPGQHATFDLTEITPRNLKAFDDAKLKRLDRELHAAFASLFAGNDKLSAEGVGREDLVNAEAFMIEEFTRRDLKHPFDDELTREARALVDKVEDPLGIEAELRRLRRRKPLVIGPSGVARTKETDDISKAGKTDRYAPIHPGSTGEYPPLKLEEVLKHFEKPFLIRAPVVRLVGSIVNNGETKNDVDVLIDGPLDEKTLQVLKFRLGRMLPPEISQRVQFHDDSDPDTGGCGPYTSYVDLYDLVVHPVAEKRVVDMRDEDAEKQQNPILIYPEKEEPRAAVFQSHFRGRSVHGDFRVKTGEDFLTGFTLAIQRAGKVPDVDTVPEGKRLAVTFNMEGSYWNKPMNAPNRVFAAVKSLQPPIWLEIEGRKFEAGEVGATAEEEGVIVRIARPQVTHLILKPFFAEYAVEGDQKFHGLLTFRLLVGRGDASEEEVETGRRTREGEAFWVAMFNKDLTPSVLRRRAIATKTLPPKGRSALPLGIKNAIPPEFRYWEKDKPSEVEATRNALIEAHLVTAETVQINRDFRLTLKTKKFWPSADIAPEIVEARTVEEAMDRIAATIATENATRLLKQLKAAPYTLTWQRFKGQVVIRAAPSSQVFHLFIKRGENEIEDFQLEGDPFENDKIAVIRRALTNVEADKLLAYEGDAPPGEKVHGVEFNPSKNTPSQMRILSRGKIEFLDDQRQFKKIRVRGGDLADVSDDGVFVLVAEEEAGDLWQWERGKQPSRAVPGEKITKAHEVRDVSLQDGTVIEDVQIWDPRKIKDADDKGGDRKELKPLAVFKPMKVAARKTNEFRGGELDRLHEDFATGALLDSGILVEPKLNGFRVALQKDGDRVFIITEEFFSRKTEQRNYMKNWPGVTAELAKLPGPFVLDAEFMEFVDGAATPRRDLARFRGTGVVDDANVQLQIFDALYLPDEGNITQKDQAERRRLLEAFLNKRQSSRIKLVPALGTARTHESLDSLIAKAAASPGSEGAMLKSANATYSLGGESDGWAKIKLIREVRGIVYDKHPVKDSPGVFNYFYAFGPIPEKEQGNWPNLIELAGKKYAPAGKSFNSKVKAESGDVLRIEVTEVLFNRMTAGKWKITGFTPTVIDVTDEAPMTVNEVVAMLNPDEIKKRASEPPPPLWDLGCQLQAKVSVEIEKPFAGFANFEACVADQKTRGHDEEAAHRICDALRRDYEKIVEKEATSSSTPVSKLELRPWTHAVKLFKAEETAKEERYVLGIVLEPETVDAQNDVYSSDEIRKAAHGFMERYGHIGLMHRKLIDGRVKILESYLAPLDFTVAEQPVKKGTWLLAARIVDDELWEAVKRGEFTGWSIGGTAIKEADPVYSILAAPFVT